MAAVTLDLHSYWFDLDYGGPVIASCSSCFESMAPPHDLTAVAQQRGTQRCPGVVQRGS